MVSEYIYMYSCVYDHSDYKHTQLVQEELHHSSEQAQSTHKQHPHPQVDVSHKRLLINTTSHKQLEGGRQKLMQKVANIMIGNEG